MMNKNDFSVSIIIPNWNGKILLEKYLPKLSRIPKITEIIIVDDHSTDDSVGLIHKLDPKIKLIIHPKRFGYASSVNDGVASSKSELVLLINTDIDPDENFLSPLIRHFSDKSVFAVGCLDRSHENGQVFTRGRGLAQWKNGFYQHSRGETDKTDTAWVSGGSGIFRKSIWDKLGGMDDIYNPFYWEDIDLSYRARKNGYKLIFEPQSIVDHYHESGAIKECFTDNYIKQISARNQFVFIWKNLANKRIWIVHLINLPIYIVRSIFHGEWFFIVGFFRAIVLIPKIIYRRKLQSNNILVNDNRL